MNDIINRIKDKTYEFEGLLELLSQRPEKEEALHPLLFTRLAEINSLFAMLEPSEPEPEPAPAEPERGEALPLSEPAASIPEPAPSISAPAAAGRPRPALCLNDRYRFTRALFGNSRKALDDALDRASRMESYEEAEEYFYGSLAFDPEDGDVSDFMAIIREYLEK